MERVERVLEKLGFSGNEIRVYLVLNDNGSMKAGRVAKLAKMDRSSGYNAIKSLQEKGLVSYVLIGKVKWFQATGPKRLLDYVREQEDDVKSVIDELHERHGRKKVEGQVRLFKGVKGVKAVFLDMIRNGTDNYVFGSEGQFSERMPEFALQFVRMKKEKGMKTFMIARKDKRDIDISKSHLRYLPDIEKSDAVTNIYGDKIAIIIWTEEPEAVVIENKAAAEAYKSYFDFMWKNGKKLK